jgi:hypothetical protein
MFGSLFDSIANTVEDFIDDPIGKSYDMVTAPLVDTLDVLEGLTEGEIRTKAALRLGADVVAGMALSEVVDYLCEED